MSSSTFSAVGIDPAGHVDIDFMSDTDRERMQRSAGPASHRFGLAHAALRQLVAAYQGCSPREARLSAGVLLDRVWFVPATPPGAAEGRRASAVPAQQP